MNPVRLQNNFMLEFAAKYNTDYQTAINIKGKWSLTG